MRLLLMWIQDIPINSREGAIFIKHIFCSEDSKRALLWGKKARRIDAPPPSEAQKHCGENSCPQPHPHGAKSLCHSSGARAVWTWWFSSTPFERWLLSSYSLYLPSRLANEAQVGEQLNWSLVTCLGYVWLYLGGTCGFPQAVWPGMRTCSGPRR